MPNTLKDSNLILAEKLVDDMNRFMKENKTEIPKEFLDLAKSYKKDGKVTFKNHEELKDFNNKLSVISFNDAKVGPIMLQSASAISDLANNNISQLDTKLNNLTTQVITQSPQFYNKDNPSPTAPPTAGQALKDWQDKMAVRTGFSKIFHEHIKHLPGKLLESVKAIMKSSEEKTEKRVKLEKKEVKQPDQKKLAKAQEKAQKKALKTPGFNKKSQVR